MTLTIYVIRLDDGKWYIGKTRKDVQARFEEHKENPGKWVSKYKPLDFKILQLDADDFDEDKYTLKYMLEYGIENVRGGQYTQEILTIPQQKSIQTSILHAKDCCFRCHKTGHFANVCTHPSCFGVTEFDVAKLKFGFDVRQPSLSSRTSMDLDKMSVHQLKEYAKENDINISGLTRRGEILSRILEQQEEVEEDAEEAEEPEQEFVSLADFQQLEKKVDELAKKITALSAHARKLTLRHRKYTNLGDYLHGKVIPNPIACSLDYLEKEGYCPTIDGDDTSDGDSVTINKDREQYMSELDKELASICETIAEAYYFKIPDVLFEETVPLDLFIENSEAKLQHGVLHMNENVVILNQAQTKKASIIIGKHILRFTYYGDTWLVSAD
jgi:hypothetical protein